MAAFGMATTVGMAECQNPDWTTGGIKFPGTKNGMLQTYANSAECVGDVLSSGSANSVIAMPSQTESGSFSMNEGTFRKWQGMNDI